MIAWVSSWAGGIAVSVILATLIELLIPSGKNKKYVRTIIGLFILFSIISPVISKFSNVSIGNLNIEVNSKSIESNKEKAASDNSELEKLYRTNLEADIKEKLLGKGYNVLITALSINLAQGDNYGRINKLSIQINEINNKNENNKNNSSDNGNTSNKIDGVDVSIKEVEKVKINVRNSTQVNTEDIDSISNEIKEEIKEYLSKEYSIDKKDITVF